MAQSSAKSAPETSPAAHHERVLIIDFGSQVTQLIARRVRENGVYCEIHPFNKVDAAFLKRYAPKAIIFSGGPCSVTDDPSPRAPEEAFKLGVPILAICYGQQTMALQLGGAVEGGHAREFGRADVEIKKASPLFEGVWDVGGRYPVWMSHGDRVTKLPEGFEVVGVSENAPFAVAVNEKRRIYSTMFHPEVVHTPDGAKLLAQLHAQDRRPQRRLDHGGVQGRSHRAHPRAGRRRHGDLRAVGRASIQAWRRC